MQQATTSERTTPWQKVVAVLMAVILALGLTPGFGVQQAYADAGETITVIGMPVTSFDSSKEYVLMAGTSTVTAMEASTNTNAAMPGVAVTATPSGDNKVITLPEGKQAANYKWTPSGDNANGWSLQNVTTTKYVGATEFYSGRVCPNDAAASKFTLSGTQLKVTESGGYWDNENLLMVWASAKDTPIFTCDEAADANGAYPVYAYEVTADSPPSTKIVPTLTVSEQQDGAAITEKAISLGNGAVQLHVDTNSDGTVSVTSSDTEKATVSCDTTAKTITVTPVAAGITTITVSVAETKTYAATTATVALTIEEAPSAPHTLSLQVTPSEYSGYVYLYDYTTSDYGDEVEIANGSASIQTGHKVSAVLGGSTRIKYEIDSITLDGTALAADDYGEYPFIMPNKDASLVFTLKEKTNGYALSKSATTHGTFSVLKRYDNYGDAQYLPAEWTENQNDTIYVEATPENGYWVESVSCLNAVTGEALGTANYYDGYWLFYMPAANVNVSVTFTNEHSYSIADLNMSSPGSSNVDPWIMTAGATEDSRIQLDKPEGKIDGKAPEKSETGIAAAGYIAVEAYTDMNGVPTSLTNAPVKSTWTNNSTYGYRWELDNQHIPFTAPSANGTYSMYVRATWYIDGKAVATKESFKWTLVVTGGANTIAVSDSIEHGTVTASVPSATKDDSITLAVEPDEGYELDTLSVRDAENNDVAVTNGAFAMPDSDVTVSATFKLKTFSVSFVDEDGTTSLKDATSYEYGTAADKITKPADPTKAADDDYAYVFDKWDPELADVTADATYKATYKAISKADTKANQKTGVSAEGGIFDAPKPEDVASYELSVEPASASDEAKAKTDHAALIGANKVVGVFDVDLTKHNTDGTNVSVTEGVGALKLTFPVDADDGTVAKVIQVHDNGTATPDVIEHTELKVAGKKVIVTLNDKLSTFIVTTQDAATDEGKIDDNTKTDDGAKAGDGAKTGDKTDDGAKTDTKTNDSTTSGTASDGKSGDSGKSSEGATTGGAKDETTTSGDSGKSDSTDSSSSSASAGKAAGKVMYRLYNAFSGERLYTADAAERDGLVGVGWTAEGEGWTAPAESDTPVYRLYNPFEPLGDHHYTTDAAERDNLVAAGWADEGIGWYSDDGKGEGLFRLYNPNAYATGMSGAHHYTVSESERDELVAVGWMAEDIAWYGMK